MQHLDLCFWWWYGRFFGTFSCVMQTLRWGVWNLVQHWGSNPGPLRWEHGVLATGPLGKSLSLCLCLDMCEFSSYKDMNHWMRVNLNPVMPCVNLLGHSTATMTLFPNKVTCTGYVWAWNLERGATLELSPLPTPPWHINTRLFLST